MLTKHDALRRQGQPGTNCARLRSYTRNDQPRLLVPTVEQAIAVLNRGDGVKCPTVYHPELFE